MNFEGVSSRAIHLKRLHYFWSNNESILSTWIRERYIHGRALHELTPSPSRDSFMWKAILKHKDEIGRQMYCGVDYNLSLVRLKLGSSLQAFCESITPPRQTDPLAVGICSKKPTKFSILLWSLHGASCPPFPLLNNRVCLPLPFVSFAMN